MPGTVTNQAFVSCSWSFEMPTAAAVAAAGYVYFRTTQHQHTNKTKPSPITETHHFDIHIIDILFPAPMVHPPPTLRA